MMWRSESYVFIDQIDSMLEKAVVTGSLGVNHLPDGSFQNRLMGSLVIFRLHILAVVFLLMRREGEIVMKDVRTKLNQQWVTYIAHL